MRAFFLALAVLTVPAVGLRAQDPSGGEFRVNSYTTDRQYQSKVASDRGGNFVVVWTSVGQDADTWGIFGQRFGASGIAQGSEFRVNTDTSDDQSRPAVASDPNGGFVVVWNGSLPSSIWGRRFDAAGSPQGGDFRIDTPGDYEADPAVASDASGNFVVVWNSYHYSLFSGPVTLIVGQRFNASGVAQGSPFQVNTITTSYRFSPSVAVDASGNFVVVWASLQDGSYSGVFGQRFDADGVPQASEFQVNTNTTDAQLDPSVAWTANGHFVVVWHSRQDGSHYGVFGQRFDAIGVREGGEFQVNTYTTEFQTGARVGSDENGNFVVTWGGRAIGNYLSEVSGQRFSASGIPIGTEFQVNTYTTLSQDAPAIAVRPDGDFVVVWQSDGQDGSSKGVFGQRFGDLIFEDGFESGDLTRWSAATGGGGLTVSDTAAMAGTSAGLQASVSDTSGLYVQDDTPNAEGRYRARFYFDPNGFDPGESESHFRTRILIAQGSGFRAITIVLKRRLGAYTVEARVRRNDGTRSDTGFFPISDGPHSIELDWQRATGPGASDGSLQLWIDGGSVATLTGIDNDVAPIDLVRMGALSVKTGAAGTLYYDQFESRRLRLIGAE